ncbi:MAG: zinc metalloprotease HtpX [Patescibacteria group bacterium]|nr:zinc metalloprotease HtpX [Patescibacteria group bacterium]
MRKATSFFKTMILFAGLTALIVGISYLIGGRGAMMSGLLIAVVMNFFAYWFSDKMVLMGTGAQPLDPNSAPELYNDTKDLAHKMGIPMPKLYITADTQPNAFATGRNPKNGVVCVTEGLVRALDRNEVRGVIAHELAHIKNYDILISSVAAVFAAAISNIGNFFFIFGGGSQQENRSPLAAIGEIAMLVLAPVAAMLIQFAISRTREYEADATAAEYTGRPQDLARALLKIEQVARATPMDVNPAYASLFIQNPFSGEGMMELFSTHPLTEKRVAKLMRMKHRP